MQAREMHTKSRTNSRTMSGSLHAETASVVIRVWTLCIIRSVPEQRQTILLI